MKINSITYTQKGEVFINENTVLNDNYDYNEVMKLAIEHGLEIVTYKENGTNYKILVETGDVVELN